MALAIIKDSQDTSWWSVVDGPKERWTSGYRGDGVDN